MYLEQNEADRRQDGIQPRPQARWPSPLSLSPPHGMGFTKSAGLLFPRPCCLLTHVPRHRSSWAVLRPLLPQEDLLASGEVGEAKRSRARPWGHSLLTLPSCPALLFQAAETGWLRPHGEVVEVIKSGRCRPDCGFKPAHLCYVNPSQDLCL